MLFIGTLKYIKLLADDDDTDDDDDDTDDDTDDDDDNDNDQCLPETSFVDETLSVRNPP